MAQATIGALRAVLGADTAIWEKNLRKSNKSLMAWAKSVKVQALAASAAFTAAAAAFGAALRTTATEMDRMGKLAAQIGVPVEELSKLTHAAELNAVSMDELGRTFRNVARNMQGAARAPTDFSRSLDALDVAWRDAEGNFLRADKVMIAVADRFAGLQDGAGKTALAMKIFGEEMGPRIIPMLNLGSAGIRRLTQEAADLGLTVSGDAARSAAEFNDAMTRLGSVTSGVMTQRLCSATR